jgi:hypothetical protein
MWKIVQPENINTNDNNDFDEALPSGNHGSYKPAIPVSQESNNPIVGWTDNNKLLSGAFLVKFLFGQGIPNGFPTQFQLAAFCIVL